MGKVVTANENLIKFYIDKGGEVYCKTVKGIENYEGFMKIDDFGAFLDDTIQIFNPGKVAKFISSKLKGREISLEDIFIN